MPKKKQKQKITPTDFSEKTFNGLDRATLDMEKDKALIVRRVLEDGDMNDLRLLRRHYTLKKIGAITTQLDELAPAALSMVACLVGIPQQKFKAYKPPSHPRTPLPKTREAKNIKPSDFSQTLFWDVRRENIDLDTSRGYVIERVIERGNLNDLRLLRKRYTLKGIASVARELRYLTPAGLSFVSCLTGVPKEKFRCYKLRQSHPIRSPF